MPGRFAHGGRWTVAAQIRELAARIAGAARVRFAREVLEGYSAAGGGLLAAGLAHAGLVALIPGVLLILGIGGMVLGDGELHDAFVDGVVDVIPPLRDLLGPAMDDLSAQAGSTTVLGAVGLAWGASRFYDAFETAISRVAGTRTRRGFLTRTLLGVLSVALLGLAFGTVTVLAAIHAFLDAAAANGERPLAGLAGLAVDLAGPLAVVGAMAIVYRHVIPVRPTWRSVFLPATVVAIVLALAVRLFVFLAPRLIGAAAVLGTLATVFVALAWLSLTFQAVLLGASWVLARDRSNPEEGRPGR
jgi:YihY family inner membrane protein